MKTLEQIKAEKLRELANLLVSYKNSRQTSYFKYRAKHGMKKWAKEPLDKVVVPLKPKGIIEGSVIYRSKEVPTKGLKLWDCGSRKQSSAILAEL